MTASVGRHGASARPGAPEPGALDAAGLRRVVAVLSTVQIVSWGVLYYAFAALQSSITEDTGWSPVAITGAFSLAQLCSGGVGIWVGRHIDAYGPRVVMTAASLVAIPGVTAVALAPNLPVFYLGWVLSRPMGSRSQRGHEPTTTAREAGRVRTARAPRPRLAGSHSFGGSDGEGGGSRSAGADREGRRRARSTRAQHAA